MSRLLLTLQRIRRVIPQEEPAVDPTKSAIQNGGDNKQILGSPRGLPDTNTYQYWRRFNERIPDLTTSIYQCKYGVHGVKPQRNPEWTPRANNYRR